jgi:hypothetical protein
VYEQDKEGKWVANIEKPFFEEAKQKFQEDKCEDGQVAKPRDIYAVELGGPYHTHGFFATTESSLTVCLTACLTLFHQIILKLDVVLQHVLQHILTLFLIQHPLSIRGHIE